VYAAVLFHIAIDVLPFLMAVNQECVVLNWNVRGVNNPARQQVVKDLINDSVFAGNETAGN
jgi:hypothetical protein